MLSTTTTTTTTTSIDNNNKTLNDTKGLAAISNPRQQEEEEEEVDVVVNSGGKDNSTMTVNDYEDNEKSCHDAIIIKSTSDETGPTSLMIVDGDTNPRYIPLAIRHDEVEVSRHQRLLKTKFCRYGPDCEFARKGQCFYVHSPQELKYRPPKPQDYPYGRDRINDNNNTTGYQYYLSYGISGEYDYNDDMYYDDYQYDNYTGMGNIDDISIPLYTEDNNNINNNNNNNNQQPQQPQGGLPIERRFSDSLDNDGYYDDEYVKDFYTNLSARRPATADPPRTISTAATPASCSSPMLITNRSNNDVTAQEPALRAMEIAIQIRDFARTNDRMLLLLQALSILGCSTENVTAHHLSGDDGTTTNPLLTALALFYASITAATTTTTTTTAAAAIPSDTNGDKDGTTPAIPPGLPPGLGDGGSGCAQQ